MQCNQIFVSHLVYYVRTLTKIGIPLEKFQIRVEPKFVGPSDFNKLSLWKMMSAAASWGLCFETFRNLDQIEENFSAPTDFASNAGSPDGIDIFLPKIPISVYFWRPWNSKFRFFYRPFGVFLSPFGFYCGPLAYIFTIWYFTPRRIWQPLTNRLRNFQFQPPPTG
jgi:hypothetical protein